MLQPVNTLRNLHVDSQVKETLKNNVFNEMFQDVMEMASSSSVANVDKSGWKNKIAGGENGNICE